MSWTDRLGDAFTRAKDEVKIGMSWVAAQPSKYWDWKTEQDAKAKGQPDFIDTVNQWADRNVMTPASDALFGGLGRAADAAGAVYSYGVARPISTVAQIAGRAAHPVAGADPLSLGTAWDRSAEVSPGQAVTLAAMGDDSLQDKGLDPQKDPFGPDQAAARRKYFHDTWEGKLRSGTVDFAGNILLDPVAGVAKAGKALSVSSRTLKSAEETSKVIKVSEGTAAAVSGREARLADKMDAFLQKTEGMTAAEIAMQPELRSTADGGALAYFFARANDSVANEADRLKVKRTLWGAALGDKDSIATLEGNHERLARELERLNQAPAQATFVAGTNGDIRNYGAGLAQVNSAEATVRDIDAQRKVVTDTMAQLQRVLDARGTSSLLKGGSRDAAETAKLASGIRQTVIRDGLGNRPTRAVVGASGARLPGHVSVKNPTAGFEQLNEALQQAPLTAETRQQLLNQYVGSATAGDRMGVVKQAEAHIVKAIGAKYGLDGAAARTMLANGNVRRGAYQNLLKSRLYSAADSDEFVHIVDPEIDEGLAISKPLLRSQIEDNVPLVDPRMLDRALKHATQNRFMEQAVRKAPGGDRFLDMADDTIDVTHDLLAMGTRAWKDSMLFRAAYPARVQMDSQLRLGAYLGVLPYLGQMSTVFGTMGKYLVKGAKFDAGEAGKKSIRQWFAPEFQEEASRELIKKLTKDLPEEFQFTDDELQKTVRTLIDKDGGIADLASELADRGLAKARTGNWGMVNPTDPNWADAYIRSVNNQIRNSPGAMHLVSGADPTDFRRLVSQDENLRNEWNELADLYDNDVESWARALHDHVDHYLPSPELREAAAKGDLGAGDLKAHFDGPAKQGNRMVVHGESYSPTAKSAFGQWRERSRKQWYTFASEAPENIMARSPLYAQAYKTRVQEIIGRLADDASIDVDAVRKSADKLARKDVGKVLFDVSHASNASHAFRFVAPFFAAWEDMMQKWSGLLYEKPWAAERLRQAWDAPNNMGLVVDSNGNRVDADGTVWNKDAQGNWYKLDAEKDKLLIGKGEYMVIPTGILGDLTGAGELRFNKKSFNVVFQGEPFWLPGTGPLVSIPVNELARKSFAAEADNPILKYVMPYGINDRSWKDQVLPSWARQARNAFGGTKDYAETYSLLLAQETARQRAGQRGDITPGEIENMARNWFIMRAITANASPVSATPSPKLAFYQEQAHLYRQKFGDKDWQDKFYQDFPDYFTMTISLNTNESGIQATDNSWRALQDPQIRQAISQNPQYGKFLLGPDAYVQPDKAGGAYDRNVATALQSAQYGYGNTDVFRGQKTPAEALKDIQTQEGWMQYSKARTAVNLELEKRGLHSMSQKGAEDLKLAHDTYVQALGAQNESWGVDYADGSEKKLPGFFSTMKSEMAKNPKLAERSDMKSLGSYLEARRAVQGILQTRDTKGIDNPKNADLKMALDMYGSQLAANDFGFEQMWNQLLSRDDLKGDY